uniref:ATP synthase subunit a n=1 Tax=Gasteruption parvicollarium TaxID=1738629 RepID=A0A2S0B8I8_9HYME|nr:ATP synthase FO subunit 6 [Gasteruption parvicollarium]ALJ93742.1 ATP synthase FO subunit 6 [Gasteruption parvicollarium]
MMTNLFSIFDPSTSYNMSLNWISSMLPLMIFPMMFWIKPSRFSMFWMLILNKLFKEFFILMNKMNTLNMLMFLSLFNLILINNFMGLYPYIFTSSSHLTFSLSLAIPLWLSFMIFGWQNNYNHMFSHMVPNGTPYILIPLMIIIENISNIIRPGTLAIRLSANMIAGHLLITLLSSTENSKSMNTLLILLMILSQCLLMILEMSVSMIQAYVFSILTTLYSNEVN